MLSVFHSEDFESGDFFVSFALVCVKIKGFEKQDGGWVDGWEWDSLGSQSQNSPLPSGLQGDAFSALELKEDNG